MCGLDFFLILFAIETGVIFCSSAYVLSEILLTYYKKQGQA